MRLRVLVVLNEVFYVLVESEHTQQQPHSYYSDVGVSVTYRSNDIIQYHLRLPCVDV